MPGRGVDLGKAAEIVRLWPLRIAKPCRIWAFCMAATGRITSGRGDITTALPVRTGAACTALHDPAGRPGLPRGPRWPAVRRCGIDHRAALMSRMAGLGRSGAVPWRGLLFDHDRVHRRAGAANHL
jgi:hypothetical protein